MEFLQIDHQILLTKKTDLKQLFPKTGIDFKTELITFTIDLDLSLRLYSETRLRSTYFRDFHGINHKLYRIFILIIFICHCFIPILSP